MKSFRGWVESCWYQPHHTLFTLALLPFSMLFRALVSVRYFLYRIGVLKTVSFPVPVIVVGNITTGGTGKTPFVIWLAGELEKLGYRPGIVSRGVGGEKSIAVPLRVSAQDDPGLAGDEAVLLARRTACPVVICRDRVAAVSHLLRETACNLVIADDGLQHYHLGRTAEIVLVDGKRKCGNGAMLPAGPLREPRKRLLRADLLLESGRDFDLSGAWLVSLQDENRKIPLDAFAHACAGRVHAVAAIGHPQKFFAVLRAAGLEVTGHAFRDHAFFRREDICFVDDLPVIMTEKDAVKCRQFASGRHWYLPVELTLPARVKAEVIALVKNRIADGARFEGKRLHDKHDKQDR